MDPATNSKLNKKKNPKTWKRELNHVLFYFFFSFSVQIPSFNILSMDFILIQNQMERKIREQEKRDSVGP